MWCLLWSGTLEGHACRKRVTTSSRCLMTRIVQNTHFWVVFRLALVLQNLESTWELVTTCKRLAFSLERLSRQIQVDSGNTCEWFYWTRSIVDSNLSSYRFYASGGQHPPQISTNAIYIVIARRSARNSIAYIGYHSESLSSQVPAFGAEFIGVSRYYKPEVDKFYQTPIILPFWLFFNIGRVSMQSDQKVNANGLWSHADFYSFFLSFFLSFCLRTILCCILRMITTRMKKLSQTLQLLAPGSKTGLPPYPLKATTFLTLLRFLLLPESPPSFPPSFYRINCPSIYVDVRVAVTNLIPFSRCHWTWVFIFNDH